MSTPAYYTQCTVQYEPFMHWCLQKTTRQHIRLKQSNTDQPLTSCICKRKATSDPLSHPQSETLLSHGNVSSSFVCSTAAPPPLFPTQTLSTMCALCRQACYWTPGGLWLAEPRPPLPCLLFLVHMHEIAGLVCACATRQEKRGRGTGARHWGRLKEEE